MADAPPPGWSARRRTKAALTIASGPEAAGSAVVCAVSRVPACGPAPSLPTTPATGVGRQGAPAAVFASILKPAPDRGLAVLSRSARAAVAAVADPAGPAPPARILSALVRLLSQNASIFGGAGGAGAGEKDGYDSRTEAAFRACLAGAVAEGCEDPGTGEPLVFASPPGIAVSAAVIVPGQGVYGATCVAAATSTEEGACASNPPPVIALFDLAGALLAALPPPSAPDHSIPGSDDGLGTPTLTIRSGHAGLPPSARPCAVTVASPGGRGGASGVSGASGLRPADVAAHLGKRLWGLVTFDAQCLSEAGRDALPLAYAASTGSVGGGQPPLAAATLALHVAERNAFPSDSGWAGGDGEDEDDEAYDDLMDEEGGGGLGMPAELKEFAGAAGEPWWV